NTVDALLHHSRALVADVSAVVVVAEENQATDVLGFPAHPGMIAKNLDSPTVTFRPVGHTCAIAVLGDDDRFIGKSLMNLVQIVAQVLWSAGVPALVIFIPLNEVHQLRHIFVGIALQRVGSI